MAHDALITEFRPATVNSWSVRIENNRRKFSEGQFRSNIRLKLSALGHQGESKLQQITQSAIMPIMTGLGIKQP
jgi:hypothetical protein